MVDIAELPPFRLEIGLIPALDVATLDDARRLLDTLDGVEGIVGFRIGAVLALRHGLPDLVRRLKDHTDLKLIYDHQRAGIGLAVDVERLAGLAQEVGIAALTIMPLGGPSILDAAIASAQAHELLPIIGGELPLADYKERAGGYVAEEAPMMIAERALGLGADHLLISGHEPGQVERYAEFATARAVRPALLIAGFSAGIRDLVKAARPCLTYLLAGRVISEAEDPREIATRMAGEAQEVA